MDPITIGALIAAGTTLTSGLLGAAAKKEEDKKQRMFEGMLRSFESKQAAAQSATTGQQNAFQQLMQGYGQALL